MGLEVKQASSVSEMCDLKELSPISEPQLSQYHLVVLRTEMICVRWPLCVPCVSPSSFEECT